MVFATPPPPLCTGLKVHVRRKECEQWAPYCLGEGRDRQPRVVASVMFWGCITPEGVGTFVPVDGTINSEKYIQILDDNLWPVAAKLFPQNPWIFQDFVPDLPLSGSRKIIYR